MKVNNLSELQERVNEVYHSILNSAFEQSQNVAGGAFDACKRAYDFAFMAVKNEDDFFMENVTLNIDDIIITDGEDRKKVKPTYSDTMLMKEVILHGEKEITLFGEDGKLAPLVHDYITKEGITMSDSAYDSLLKHISKGCSTGDYSFPTLLSEGTEDVIRRAEYALCQFYKTYPSSLREMDRRVFPSRVTIEHLLKDVLAEYLTRQKESITERLKNCSSSTDAKELLEEFSVIQERTNKVYESLGRDITPNKQ